MCDILFVTTNMIYLFRYHNFVVFNSHKFKRVLLHMRAFQIKTISIRQDINVCNC